MDKMVDGNENLLANETSLNPPPTTSESDAAENTYSHSEDEQMKENRPFLEVQIGDVYLEALTIRIKSSLDEQDKLVEEPVEVIIANAKPESELIVNPSITTAAKPSPQSLQIVKNPPKRRKNRRKRNQKTYYKIDNTMWNIYQALKLMGT
ncbi:hypothetical protein PV327_004165 [Microctonus hyperodae]|uniref:Uncharacterized protein n=1 Tax=Microctonus hyperodae TaxID=165561 RepID=A0AA39KM76_MICHY|nr:hypothetical protein PV327_004165 [Microctonus hyperodae]